MKNISQSGQTLIEITFLVVIAAIIIGNLLLLNAIAVQNTTTSGKLAFARILSQQGLETIINMRGKANESIIIDQESYSWTQLFNGTIPLLSCANPIDPTIACTDFTLSQCGSNTSSNKYFCIVKNTRVYTDSSWKMPDKKNNTIYRKIRITNAGKGEKNVTTFIYWIDSNGLHNWPLSRILKSDIE